MTSGGPWGVGAQDLTHGLFGLYEFLFSRLDEHLEDPCAKEGKDEATGNDGDGND